MRENQYTLRKLINGAILIPAVFLSLLLSAYFDLSVIVTIGLAIGLTATFVVIVNKWPVLDRPISKTAYTVWNVLIIFTFVIVYYSVRSSM